MPPERLKEIIDRCMKRRRDQKRTLHLIELADFLGVQPITIRRWLKGLSPIPRPVEIILEIYDAHPAQAPQFNIAANRHRNSTTQI